MHNSVNHFHLAIPTHDLDQAWSFYIEGLGCPSGRRYDNRITLNFFGDQLVCHLSPDAVDAEPRMYPRHFGLIFQELSEFERVLDRARTLELDFYRDEFIRFEGLEEEHRSFFLVDPSNNLVEFKHYRNPEAMN